MSIRLFLNILMDGKKTVAVIFGGRSGEHEVSLVSATSIISSIDKEKFNVLEVGIAPSGNWFTGTNCLEKFKKQDYSNLMELDISMNCQKKGFVANDIFFAVDIIFPVLHGPFGEDGTIQGLFEMMQVPYVGCNVLASSTAMDKLQCKALWQSAGLPVVPYIGITRRAWQMEPELISQDIKKKFGFPCFVKPANMGSSVGVSKVKNQNELHRAIDLAAKYDRRILIEKGINVREIECAVLGNETAIASPLGEIFVGGEFYDFNDKYIDGKSTTKVPAEIVENLAQEMREMAVKAYKLLDCSGLARVDMFIDKDTGEFYLNELNTMPGFTAISMYPKMIEAQGIPYPELIAKLMEYGFEMYEDRQKNQVVFRSGSDWFKE